LNYLKSRVNCLKVAELVINCLENEEVKFVFGIPGEENLELMDAIHDSAVRFIPTRHEGAGAFMADMYGRLTGRAGVCMATLGPGATNLVTGIADAYLDRAPLVAITAQEPLSQIHKESHQFIDIPGLLRPITKWNARMGHHSGVSEIVRKAFKIAQTEKPGPTHIEIPADIASAETAEAPLSWERTRRPSPDRQSLQRAAELIDSSESPMILAGNGVIRGDASQELTEFAEEFRIPVAHTLMGKGAIPWSSPMCLLTVGVQTYDCNHAGFNTSDLIICVGYDHVEYDPKIWNPKGNKRIIHLDFTPAEISTNYVTEVEIVADIRESVKLLGEMIRKSRSQDRVSELRSSITAKLESWRKQSEGSLKPPAILQKLRETLTHDDVLVSDVGAHKVWLGRFFETYRPRTFFVSNGLASMGIAIPGGVAIKLVAPRTRVVTLSGDGGFLMSVHELETARRENAATVNLVFRDGGLGSIRWKQLTRFGRTTGTEFGNPDMLLLAKAFGIHGFKVTSIREFQSILEEALKLNEPSLVDIPVDYSDNPFLSQQMGTAITQS
jgi:acetolactate synthase-1/2/3 large subunit